MCTITCLIVLAATFLVIAFHTNWIENILGKCQSASSQAEKQGNRTEGGQNTLGQSQDQPPQGRPGGDKDGRQPHQGGPPNDEQPHQGDPRFPGGELPDGPPPGPGGGPPEPPRREPPPHPPPPPPPPPTPKEEYEKRLRYGSSLNEGNRPEYEDTKTTYEITRTRRTTERKWKTDLATENSITHSESSYATEEERHWSPDTTNKNEIYDTTSNTNLETQTQILSVKEFVKEKQSMHKVMSLLEEILTNMSEKSKTSKNSE